MSNYKYYKCLKILSKKKVYISSTYNMLQVMKILIINLCLVTQQKYNFIMWFLNINYYDNLSDLSIINYYTCEL